MKHIVVLSTGGTIASRPGPEGRNIAGALPGDALMQKVGDIQGVTLEVISLFQKSSNSLTADDLQTLRAECQRLIDAGGTDGIVITHGTDTLEDTAYFLECSVDTRGVVLVLTGAQRVPHAPGTDSGVNLRHALLAAAADDCRGLGVLLVFNETVQSASFVRKTSSFQLNGFESPGMGRLGLIDSDTVHIYQMPRRQPLLPASSAKLPQVEIASVYQGASPLALQALVDAGVRGIVIDGVGRGQVPPDWPPIVRRAVAAGTTVLVCSSTLHGPVLPCYEYPGSLHDLQQAGAIGVSGLSARKVRIRLMLALAGTETALQHQDIQRLFAWGVDRSA